MVHGLRLLIPLELGSGDWPFFFCVCSSCSLAAIFGLDLETNALVLATVTVLAGAIITFGYHNTAFTVKTALLAKRVSGGLPFSAIRFFLLLAVLSFFFFENDVSTISFVIIPLWKSLLKRAEFFSFFLFLFIFFFPFFLSGRTCF